MRSEPADFWRRMIAAVIYFTYESPRLPQGEDELHFGGWSDRGSVAMVAAILAVSPVSRLGMIVRP